MKIKYILLIAALLFLSVISKLFTSDDAIIVEIDNIHRILEVESFGLTKDLLVRIEATGGIESRCDQLYAYPWILDADSRKVIWEFSRGQSGSKRGRRKIETEDEIFLKAGNYEVYYGVNPSRSIHINKLGDLLKGIFDGFKRSPEYSPDFGITIYAARGSSEMRYVTKGSSIENEQAIIQLCKTGDDAHNQQGFSINRDLDLRIYAIGEGSKRQREMYDYGWIIDAHSRKRVWEMKSQNCEPAGGAKKNLLFDDIVRLPAGNYIAYYVSDGSHSYEEWNSMPPFDPKHWGLTIWGSGINFSGTYITPYQEPESSQPIVELTAMRDDEYEIQGFSLAKPAKLRIYALGEYSHSDRCMADYGWIEEARTRRRVWEMRYRDTKHAGGGKKNRLFDGIISLAPGDYLVYYITDDSHSFRDWNVGPPYNPDAWGITIRGVGKDFSRESVRNYREEEDPNLLAQIIRVGDDEYVKEEFTLKHRTRIRIYAIGEGDRYEMHDYGWIEDDRGRTEWKMKYRDTDHAGGARKNRLFDDTIYLDPGTYYAGFRTDDSHSYRDWNSSAPDDPVHWGIMITVDE